ncbi:MAG: AsmA family protein [Planctomycetes bacterium]|nr:AsmA family protein [Planctomycetota bacterium]
MNQPQPPETPRKRRRLLKAALIALLALPILVVAAPYILPTGWIRSKVSAIVKETTGIELAIESLSLRWTGATVKGIAAGDAGEGPRAAEVGLVETDLSFLPLLRGEIVVDRVLVRGATLRLVRRADGTLVLPLPPMPEGTPAPAEAGEASPLPPVKASVTIEACSARIECEDDPSRSVSIEPIDGTIEVESLDKPIRVSLHAGPAGRGVAIAATATIAKGGVIDTDAIAAEATVTVESFDGTPFARLFAPGLPEGTSAGDLHGELTATLALHVAQIEGTFHIHDARFDGAALPASVVFVTADADLAATSAHLKNLKFHTDGFRMQATGEASMGGDTPRASGNANIAIDATAIGTWAAGIIPGLEAGGAVDILVTGSLEGDVAQGRVEAVGRDIRVRGEGIPSAALANFRGTLQGSADLAAERASFHDTTLTLPGLAVTVEGDWTGFSPQGTGRVEARGTISSLGDLRDALTGLVGEMPTRIAGTGEFSATASVGEGGVLDVSSSAALRDVKVTDETGAALFTSQAPLTLEEEAHIDPVAKTVEIRRSLVDFGAGRVTAEGSLSAATEGTGEGRLAANVEIDLGKALSLVRGFVPVPEGYSLEGTATATATVTGSLDRPSIDVAGTMDERTPGGRRRTGLALRAQADLPAQTATLETLDVTSGPDTIRASGRVEGFSARAGGNAVLSVSIEDVGAWVARVEPILPADLPRASGPVRMTLGAEGGAGVWALRDLTASGDLLVTSPSLLPGGPWQSGPFRVTATAASVSYEEIKDFDLGAAWADLVVTSRANAAGLASKRPTGTGALTVEGTLDGIAPLLASLGIADLSVAGSGPIRVLVSGEATEAISADLSVDWATPHIALGSGGARVEVARGEVTVRARLEAPLNLSRADMPSLEVRSGSLALTGNAALSALSPLPAIEGLHLEGTADLADVATIGLVAASLPPGTEMTGPATFTIDAHGTPDDLSATVSAVATDADLTLPETFLKPAGTPLSLEAEARYRGSEAAIPSFRARFAEADLSGSATLALGGTIFPKEATIRLPETQIPMLARYLPALAALAPTGAVSMNGTLSPDASGNAAAHGTLAFHALTVKIPDGTQTVALDGPVTYRLDGATDLLTSESLAARIDGQPATVRVNLTGIARAAKAFLAAPSAPAATQQEPGGEPAVVDMDLTPLLPPLREVSGSVLIQIPDFELMRNRLTNLRLHVTLDGGRIAITDAGGGINNGTLAIRMAADVSTDRPTWEFGLDMRDVNVLIENAPTLALINPLLAKIEGAAGRSEYVFSLPVTILAEGALQSEILRTARTKEDATLLMAEGTIEGSRILQLIGSLIEKEGLLPYRFDGMEANFRIGGGRIDLLRAAFRGNENTIMLSGWTSLVPVEDGERKGQHPMSQRMSFTGTLAHSDDPIKQKVYDAIFAEGGILMEGTVEAPEFHLDFREAIARAARDIARDRLREEAGDRLRDLFRNR